MTPRGIEQVAFMAPGAAVHGDVRFGEGASVWFNAVVRAEDHGVEIGAYTNLQDHAMIHVGNDSGTRIGEYCSITHHATIHGAIVGNCCLIGIGATVMDGSSIGDNSIVAGHCIVAEGQQIPANSIVAGVPGKVVAARNNYVSNKINAYAYYRNALAYANGNHRLWSERTYQADVHAMELRYRQELEQSGSQPP